MIKVSNILGKYFLKVVYAWLRTEGRSFPYLNVSKVWEHIYTIRNLFFCNAIVLSIFQRFVSFPYIQLGKV
jgi:hypothetical protein